MNKNDYYKELKASLTILAALALLIITTYVLNEVIFLSLISYVTISVLFRVLTINIKNKSLQTASFIISFPLAVVWTILKLLIPFWQLFINVMLYFGTGFLITVFVFKFLYYFNWLDNIKEPTIVYLKITLSVLLIVVMNQLLRDFVVFLTQSKNSEKLKGYELGKLTDYVLSKDNVRGVIYTSYLFVLVIMNCFNFQGVSYSNTLGLDKSILQSFVTFIAYDRAIGLLNQLPFRPSELLDKIYKSN